jgi:hypothetical protein
LVSVVLPTPPLLIVIAIVRMCSFSFLQLCTDAQLLSRKRCDHDAQIYPVLLPCHFC